MLQKSYSSLEAIPENQRGAYVQKGAEYVLDDLSADHPVIVHNKTLLSEKTTATNKVAELTSDLETAKGSSIPRGHKAVANADVELLEKVKAHGTGDEVVAKLTEHKALKEANDKRTTEDHLREVAKLLSYEPEAFVRLSGLPEFEIRDKDGQKTVIAKLKDDKGVITEKPAQEFVENSADFAPFLPALKAEGKGGVRVPPSGSGSSSAGKDVFQKAREAGETHNKARAQGTSIDDRFGLTKTA